MRGNGNSLFAPWTSVRKFTFFFILALALFFAVFVTVPIGVVAAGFFAGCMALWQDTTPPMAHNRYPYAEESFAKRLAEFFMAARMKWRESVNPVIIFGFGPPREDAAHDIASASWLPVARLSSIWAFIAAIALATIDVVVNPYLYTAWGGMEGIKMPGFVAAIFSAVAWFALIQFVLDIFRHRAEGNGIIGSYPAPSVMLNKVSAWEQSKSPLLVSAIIAVAVTFTVLMLLVTLSQPLWYALAMLPVVYIVLALGLVSRGFVPPYREEWQEEIDQREMWGGVNEPLGDDATALVDITPLPTAEEWAQEHPDEPYSPYMHVARAVFPQGKGIGVYLDKEEVFASGLNAGQLVIAPIEETDDKGRKIAGTAGLKAMSVWYTEEGKHYGIDDIFREDAKGWEKDFAIRQNVLKHLRGIKGIGECFLVGYTIHTKPPSRRRDKNADRNLAEIKVRPLNSNVSINNFRDGAVTETLKSLLKVDYVRAFSKPGSGDVVSILVGDDPSANIEFKRPGMATIRTIRDADFSHIFHANKMYSTFGAPKMLDYAEINSVQEQEFMLPVGLSFDEIASRINVIKENTGNAFMEIREGPSGALAKSRGGMKKNVEEGQTLFTITSARVNPLNEVFFFKDHMDKFIVGRKPGVVNLKWSPGIMSNSQLAWDDFDSKDPHLLIAGSSGSGKSVVVRNMVVQLIANNLPQDLQIWMVEPKIGFQLFKKFDSVVRLVDSQNPTDDFFNNVAEWAHDLLQEMIRRNKVMANYEHPETFTIPEKLKEAREIAEMEGVTRPDGSMHELMIPYIVAFIEECATVFADSANKEQKAIQSQILTDVSRLAREARAAGIHLVALTQYPTNASIPSVIRNQMRRIGLTCKNSLASRVCIDEDGLEKLTIKGTGLIQDKSGRYVMFRGYLLESKDVMDALADIPQRGKEETSVKTDSSGKFISIDDIGLDDTAGKIWEAINGAQLQDAIDSAKPTKDITENDHLKKLEKAGIKETVKVK